MPVEELNPTVSMLSRSNSLVHIIDFHRHIKSFKQLFRSAEETNKKQNTFDLLTYRTQQEDE